MSSSNILTTFYFLLEGIGNTLLGNIHMFFLSVFYRAYSRRITATIPPPITEDTRHTGVYCSGNSYTYCCFSCLFWIAIDWYICFAPVGYESQRRLNQRELPCRGV